MAGPSGTPGRPLNRPPAVDLERRLRALARLLHLERPADLPLLLLPALAALWAGTGATPGWAEILVVVVGGTLARSAAWAVADLPWSAAMARHLLEPAPLPGLEPLTHRDALLAVTVPALLALLIALPGGGPALLAAAGAALLVGLLPWLRRRTFLGEGLLGLVVGTGPLIAYAVAAGAPDKPAWLLAIATALWVTAWGTLAAATRLEADLRAGRRSLAQFLGEADRFLAAFLQGCALLAWLLAGRQLGLGVFYELGLATALGLVVYQQGLLHRRSTAAYRRAFRSNLAFALAVFCGTAFHYLCAASRAAG